MKNVHLLPTDKPTRLFYDISLDKLIIATTAEVSKWFDNKHIFITSDEQIKEGDWFINKNGYISICVKAFEEWLKTNKSEIKKIILTTDQDLIKEGVQAIDDTFLEWFVNNPSCENVVVITEQYTQNYHKDIWYNRYKIIIPQEEPDYTALLQPVGTRQETLGEVAERLTKDFPHYSVRDNMDDSDIKGWFLEALQKGAEWQAERMYNPEEVIKIVEKSRETGLTAEYLLLTEQFKKKQ